MAETETIEPIGEFCQRSRTFSGNSSKYCCVLLIVVCKYSTLGNFLR